LRDPVESEDATTDTLVEPTRPEGLGARSGGSEADRSDEESPKIAAAPDARE
jgi:hypothetical protein